MTIILFFELGHGVAILESRWKVSVESYIQYIYLTHNLPLQLTGFTQLN